VAGVDLSDFFTRYVRGHETPPYDEAFAVVGLRLVRSAGRQSFTAGIMLDQRDPQSMRIESVQSGSAAERAGLKQGDVLVSIGKAFVTSASWRGALNIFRQGERVPVSVRRARQTISTSMTLDAPDIHDYRIEETKDAPPETRTLRAAWLQSSRQ
jgi:predicted metalloprotease with PDZ domain